MGLEEQRITNYEVSMSALPDKIENKAAWLKSRFDARTDGEIKEKHNGLVDALKAPEAAAELGVRVEGLTAETVEDAVKEVLGREATHEAGRENPHGVTAAQTGAYTKEETQRHIDAKVAEIGAGDMAKAVYDPTGSGKVTAAFTADTATDRTARAAAESAQFAADTAQCAADRAQCAADTAQTGANAAAAAATAAQATAGAAMPKTGGVFTGSINAKSVSVINELRLSALDNYGLRCDAVTGFNLLWSIAGTKIVDKAGNLRTLMASNVSGSSARRYKHAIADMAPETAQKLLLTRPVSFFYNAELGDPGEKYGLIADELETVDATACYYNADGEVEGINYTMLVTPLIKLCQIQQEQIDALSERLTTLEREREGK